MAAGGDGARFYDRDGVYRGAIHVDETVAALITTGRWLFVATGTNIGSGYRASKLYQFNIDTWAETTYPLDRARFSESAAGTDVLVFSEGVGTLARLRPSTGQIDRWSNGDVQGLSIGPGPIVVSPDGTTAVADPVDVGLWRQQYDLSTTPPTLIGTASRSGTLYGFSADGNHIAEWRPSQIAFVPLPLAGTTGRVIPFPLYEPRFASTSANGGWDIVHGQIMGPNTGQMSFYRHGSDTTEYYRLATSTPPHGVVWAPDGSWFVVEGDSLEFFAAPGSPAPAKLRRGAYGEYTAIAPVRAMDSRFGVGTSPVALGPGEGRDIAVTGLGDVPWAGVTAVAVNVTIVGPSEPTYVALHPSGQPTPIVSNVNAGAGETVANGAVVALGAGGRVRVYNAAGSAHVLVDVAGYFATVSGQAGSRFHPVTPTRIADTRTSAPVGPDGLIGIPVRGVGPVPVGATAVALKVVAVAPSTETFVTVFPSDAGLPLASNINALAGTTAANSVFSGIGADGNVAFYNAAGDLHLVVDVVGYWDTDRTTDAGRFIPLPRPDRRYDTRWVLPGNWTTLGHGPGEIQPYRVADPTGPAPPARQVYWAEPWVLPSPWGAAVVFNLTATATTAGGYLLAFPGPVGATPPFASTVNFAAGQTAASLSVSGFDATGVVNILNAAGHSEVIIDIAGFFTGDAF